MKPASRPSATPPTASSTLGTASRAETERQSMPVVFCSPHSGSGYTPAFLTAVKADLVSLRQLEDSFVDELFAAAPERGGGGARGLCHLVTDRYQCGSPPRAVEKSLAEMPVSRSTHLHIQIALLRF